MDSYDILGVTRDSSDKEIEIAYEDLKKKYNPSFNTSIHAYKKYREIVSSYENIKNEQRRKMYDLKSFKSNVEIEEKVYELYDFKSGKEEIIAKSVDYSKAEDLNEVNCKDIELKVRISYLYKLLNLRCDLEYYHKVMCPDCKEFRECEVCNGNKVVEYKEHVVWCPHCRGEGKVSVNCKSCGNSGYKTVKDALSIYVDEDIKEFKGYGDEYSNSLKSNLKVEFDYYDKENIEIDENNIKIKYYLNEEETLSGINKEYFTEFGAFNLIIPSFVEDGYKQEITFNNKNLIFTFYNNAYNGKDKRMYLLVSKEFKDRYIYFNDDYSACSEVETVEYSNVVKCDNTIVINGKGFVGKYGGKDGDLIIKVYFNNGNLIYTDNLKVLDTSKLFNILGGSVDGFNHKGFKGINALIKRNDTYYLLSGLNNEKSKLKEYFMFKIIGILLWSLIPLLIVVLPYNQMTFIILICVLVLYLVLLNILMEAEV